MIGIKQPSLQRLIRRRRIPAPPLQHLGNVSVRLWTRQDIAKAKRAIAARRNHHVGPVLRRAARIAFRWRRRWISDHSLQYGDGGRDYHPREILTPQEVAKWLKVPVSWVYEKSRRRCENPLPVMRIGRYIRFDKYRVAMWLEKQVASEVGAQ